MVFQEFSKNCIIILMGQLFQQFLYYHQRGFSPIFSDLDLNSSDSVKLSFSSFL